MPKQTKLRYAELGSGCKFASHIFANCLATFKDTDISMVIDHARIAAVVITGEVFQVALHKTWQPRGAAGCDTVLGSQLGLELDGSEIAERTATHRPPV